MSNKPVHFHELPIKKMIEHHDFTYCMSDDNRYYEQGRQQLQLINKKVDEEYGGWSKELVDHWNKYAPHSTEMSWRKQY